MSSDDVQNKEATHFIVAVVSGGKIRRQLLELAQTRKKKAAKG
jgi:hypothetical protein